MPSPTFITAFYQFAQLTKDEVAALQKKLEEFGMQQDMRGLTLIATEGINGTVCGSESAIAEWKKLLAEIFPSISWNDSQANAPVLARWEVEMRKEIVNLHMPDVPAAALNHHVSPEQWNAMLQEDVVVIDARNVYETKIGTFKHAIDPKIQNFQEFKEFAKTAELPKDKKILMYCTGGIRCEKAVLEMQKNGYEHVYQLKGGILAYLQQFPRKNFEGECFVFDDRVSVDQELKPSQKYKLCPHCGNPGDTMIACKRCEKTCVICDTCSQQQIRHTCSKDCRNKSVLAHA